MTYVAQLTRQAEKHFRVIPQKDKDRIKKVLQEMTEDPLAGDVIKLSGYNAYRRRVGNFRIIFSISGTELTMLVFDILRHNDTIYKNL